MKLLARRSSGERPTIATSRSCRARRSQTALEIREEILDGLETDREPDRSGADAGRGELGVGELPVRRARRVDDEALRVADVREVAPERERVDEPAPGVAAAREVEDEDRAGAAREIPLD